MTPVDGKAFGNRQDELLRRVPKRFENLRYVGQGLTGTVVRALDSKSGQEVALKILPPDLVRNELFAKRMTREALALARINHPNVVRFLDYCRVQDIMFLVVEFVQGQTLDKYLLAHQPGPLRAVELVAQAADGLSAAHAESIVHRDIKPTNVMITNDGQAKLIDFGLARLPAPENLSALTTAGRRLGTLRYMAPETLDGGLTNEATDVFQLGVVLYEALTGVHPLEGGPLSVFCGTRAEGSILAPSKRNPDLDPALDSIVQRTLAFDPIHRTATAKDICRELCLWLAEAATRAQ